MSIVKDLLNFASKFWWVVVRTRIWLTHIENTFMLDHAALVANTIVGYDINFACCIVEEIHERTLKRTTSILFPFLVHRLCVEAGAKIIPNIDSIIGVQKT